MNSRRFPFSPVLTAGLLTLAALTRTWAAPANDDFANRQSIPAGTTVSVTGTTVGATQEAFEKTNGAGSPPGDSINETKTVWYDWVPPVSGTVHATLSDFTSQGLTYLLVFQGASAPTLSQLVAQGYLPGDPTDGDPAPPDFNVTAGQEYTFSLGNTNYPGAFTFNLVLTPASPSVSLTASQPQAVRSTGQKGKFLFTLSSPATTALTVNYQVQGSAISGTDYKTLKGTVVVPAGASSAQVNVKPLPGGTDEKGKPGKVKLTLETGTGYTVGSTATAKVIILDND